MSLAVANEAEFSCDGHCGQCHTCGDALREALDGEEWCPTCETWRRYESHGFSEI